MRLNRFHFVHFKLLDDANLFRAYASVCFVLFCLDFFFFFLFSFCDDQSLQSFSNAFTFSFTQKHIIVYDVWNHSTIGFVSGNTQTQIVVSIILFFDFFFFYLFLTLLCHDILYDK